MKPDWREAPDWATFLGQDTDGKWFWYSEKPFACKDGSWRVSHESGAKWEEAFPMGLLEQRP